MILPGSLSGPFGVLALIVPCAALVLLALRLPIVQFRTVRVQAAGIIVCAILLWVGAAASIIAAIAAGFLEARLFRRDRTARIQVILDSLAMAVAAAVGWLVLAESAVPQVASASAGRLYLLALEHTAPAVVTFLVMYGIGTVALESSVAVSRKRTSSASRRLRTGVTVAAFAVLALLAPAGTAIGPVALLVLAAVLLLVGFLVRRGFELSSLRRRLSVSQAMGLASLADAATAEPTALLYRFLHLAKNLVHAERSLVWMVDDVNGEILPAVGLPDMGEFAGLRTRLGEGLIGSAAERSRPLIVSDAARTLRRGEKEPAADSWLLYPILSQKKVLGVAHWTRPSSTPFTAEDAAQLEGLVPHVGVAVESLRARNKMRELAATDGLTGLYNHRRTCELLRDEMRRAERYNRPLSVLMLDVDSFKSFNDNYGHPSGDQLLRSVAQLLRAGVRTVDKVGRYGGEEFVIIMPETHKDDAFLLAERIRRTIEQQAFIVVAGEEIHRTVSVGVASYPEDGLNPQEVIERADEALYRAKHSGRNCVIWA